MAAVNWFCLVLAFAFINRYVCIKVDPNEIPNGNYTTINLNNQTLLPHEKSTLSSLSNSNEPDNFTLLGDSELSASERTRRLIPYMAFYVPVSDLPINKQYDSKNNIHALTRPSAIGSSGNHIPVPNQYVHTGVQYLPQASAATASASQSSALKGGIQYYQPNAGLGSYRTPQGVGGEGGGAGGYGGQQQQQFNLLSPTTGHTQQHLQAPPGPPGPSAPLATGFGKGNGNNHNTFVTYKKINPIRHKTVQHFPPLSSTASTAYSVSSSAATAKQQLHKVHYNAGSGRGSSGGDAAAAVYLPRAKQSKINLTPFTPSNTVPGHFVPIVYTPVNSNNNDNNNNNYNSNILNSQASAIGEINDSSYNQQHHHYQPQQIAVEYSSGPLPPSSSTASAPSKPIDVQPVPQHYQQQQQQQHNPKQQSQYYSVTTSPVNVDLTHNVVGGGSLASRNPVNAAHHHHHHHHHNAETISPPPTIYHQNHHLQEQPEHVIIEASLRASQQPHTVTVIGSQQQQQNQRQHLVHSGKSAIQFQPPKPESFFESELQLQQHHNIEQVLKDVNSYTIKSSQMMTPQEKYVMYLQQRMRYNKHQQRQQAIRHRYREHNSNNNDKESEHQQHQQQQQQYIKQHQQNPTEIFALSSTMSPPPSTHVSPGTVTALLPLLFPQPSLQYVSNYTQHSPIHHDLYPRPELKPLANGGGFRAVAATGGAEEEHVLTIPVHSLFAELEALQHQRNNHYSQSHSASSSSHQKSQYSKNGSSKSQYIDYVIDEPKQSLDEEQQHHQYPQQQLKLLKPTLGPPSHAFVLVTTAAPLLIEPVAAQKINYKNYGSHLRPSNKSKPNIRLQPVLKENNVNYATIRELTPTPKSHPYNGDDETPKYVYVKEEFGQKIAMGQAANGEGSGSVKLKPSNKYESVDNQIPQQWQQHHYHQQHADSVALQPLEPRQPITPHHHNNHTNEEQNNVAVNGIETPTPPKTILADPNELPDIRTSSLAEILHKLQESNHLPHTLTPDNIDNSIKTLIRILNNLKQTQTIVANPPQHHETPTHSHPSSPDYDYTTGSEEGQQQQKQQPPHDLSLLTPTGPNKHPGPSTGRPGIDYPNYAEIPQTSFDCSEQRYKGFFGDPETNCQVWHYCDLNGGKASFLCPNGTIFSQIALTCDWWFNVKCATTTQLYVLNERLYKYILPFTPKFPEDYSGPIVDKYLAMKFQEMEEKMRLEKEKAAKEEADVVIKTEQPVKTVSEASKEDNHLQEMTTEDNTNRYVKSHDTSNHNHESVNSQVSEKSMERNRLIDDEVNDISQRDKVDNFDSSTIATMTATIKPDIISFSLKPIIVSSTSGPDYDDEPLRHHENEKRSHVKLAVDLAINKTETEERLTDDEKNTNSSGGGDGNTENSLTSVPTTATSLSNNNMQITVEKVEVIEIKPDEATGSLIRDMLLNSEETEK